MSLKKIWPLFLVLVALSFFEFRNFLTQPRIAADEAIYIQIARNFNEYGVLKLQNAPGIFASESWRYQAGSGWVMQFSLSSAFEIFGASYSTARAVMAAYLFGFVIIVFFLLYRRFGLLAATLGCLLIVTFASFYGNGKMVQGENIGAFWLALGLLASDVLKSRPVLRATFAGIGFGLFFGTKTAFIFIGLPLLFIINAIELYRARETFKSLALFWVVLIGSILPSFWFGSIHPWTWQNIISTTRYYSNNYQSVCISCDFMTNLKHLATGSTFWHLEILTVLTGLYLTRFNEVLRDWRVRWLIFYSLLTFVYFLKSPGTNRYLMHIQLLLLALTPAMLFALLRERAVLVRRLGIAAVISLIVAQAVHTIAFSDMLYSSAAPELAKFIRERVSADKSIGVINVPVAAAAVPAAQLYQFTAMNRLPDGENLLSWTEDRLPDILIHSERGDSFFYVNPYRDVLDKHYRQIANFGDGSYIVMQKLSP